MDKKKSLVRLVDDDITVLNAQSMFLQMADFNVSCYQGAIEFLEKDDHSVNGCVVLDVRMPNMTGIELQEEMKRQNIDLPIIFLSAHGDIEMAVRAVQDGAMTFLVKPPKRDQLISVIEQAFELNDRQRKEKRYLASLLKQWNELTQAEKNVAQMVAKGLTNQVIADVLKISERTVRSQRATVYEKLEVENAAELSEFLHELNKYGELQ